MVKQAFITYYRNNLFYTIFFLLFYKSVNLSLILTYVLFVLHNNIIIFINNNIWLSNNFPEDPGDVTATKIEP